MTVTFLATGALRKPFLICTSIIQYNLATSKVSVTNTPEDLHWGLPIICRNIRYINCVGLFMCVEY